MPATPSPVQIAPLVRWLRHEKVMLDADLAELYGVETKALNRAVKRNADRFPADFMFRLTLAEAEDLRCQIGTSSPRHGGRRYLPYAFTEQGVAMLSSVLRSPRAVEVNIAIMRTFVQLRRLMDGNLELARKIEALGEALRRAVRRRLRSHQAARGRGGGGRCFPQAPHRLPFLTECHSAGGSRRAARPLLRRVGPGARIGIVLVEVLEHRRALLFVSLRRIHARQSLVEQVLNGESDL